MHDFRVPAPNCYRLRLDPMSRQPQNICTWYQLHVEVFFCASLFESCDESVDYAMDPVKSRMSRNRN